jgi:calcineurin-like phosphoesterase
MPVRFEPADGGVRLEGVMIECDGGGRASSIEAVRIAE